MELFLTYHGTLNWVDVSPAVLTVLAVRDTISQLNYINWFGNPMSSHHVSVLSDTSENITIFCETRSAWYSQMYQLCFAYSRFILYYLCTVKSLILLLVIYNLRPYPIHHDAWEDFANIFYTLMSGQSFSWWILRGLWYHNLYSNFRPILSMMTHEMIVLAQCFSVAFLLLRGRSAVGIWRWFGRGGVIHGKKDNKGWGRFKK